MIDPRTAAEGEDYLAYNQRRWGSDSWTQSLRRYLLLTTSPPLLSSVILVSCPLSSHVLFSYEMPVSMPHALSSARPVHVCGLLASSFFPVRIPVPFELC